MFEHFHADCLVKGAAKCDTLGDIQESEEKDR